MDIYDSTLLFNTQRLRRHPLKPKVSVIIPVSSASGTIQRAIDSILTQTYINTEVVIVLNASDGATTAIVKKNANADSRINVISIPVPGRSLARNVGLKVASGEYVQFLDADDTLEKNKLKKSVDFLNENGMFYAYCTRIEYFDERKNSEQNLDMKVDMQKLIYENIFPINSLLFRNSEVTYFDENLNYNEDWLFWMDNLDDKSVKFDRKYVGGVVNITGRNSMRDYQTMFINFVYVRSVIKRKYFYRNEMKTHYKDFNLLKSYFCIENNNLKIENEIKKNFGFIYYIVNFLFKVRPIKNKWVREYKKNLHNMYSV